MAMQRSANAVRLEFRADSLVTTNLSGAAFTGDWLWVAGDEACGVDRLQRLAPVGNESLRFGKVRDFPLAELLDLPGGTDDEADLEGMAVEDGWLWLVGSHGTKRKSPKPGRGHADNAQRLATVTLDANRRLLARIPIEHDADGVPALVRQARDGRRAARLDGDARGNPLTRLLARDPHIAPFLAIPGKDNGLDIEGLAVLGDHLLLGLRGPVLRGWSALIEVRWTTQRGHLALVPLGPGGLRLRKHFLALDGLGVRDLHVHGDDLYLLAGPTMALDGDVRVFRWPGARRALAAHREPVRFESGLEDVLALPHGRGTDRAEALCALPSALARGGPKWLVLYDAPGRARRSGARTVFGDLLARR